MPLMATYPWHLERFRAALACLSWAREHGSELPPRLASSAWCLASLLSGGLGAAAYSKSSREVWPSGQAPTQAGEHQG